MAKKESMVKIAPSIISANFACLEKEINKVKEAEWLHIDVMDGRFVPDITIGPHIVKTLRKMTRQLLDVHLMVESPEKQIESFAKAGADLITVHAEACANLESVIHEIKKNGCMAGVSIRPSTDVNMIENVLCLIDVVLVMSVEPGFSGKEFIPSVLPKIKRLKEIATKRKLNFKIEVDGGINKENCKSVAEAGADIIVSGSAIFKSEDPTKMLKIIREKANKITRNKEGV